MTDIDYRNYGLEPVNNNDVDYKSYGLEPIAGQAEGQTIQPENKTSSTFLGQLPTQKPEEFTAGSPANTEAINTLISGFGGGPGIKMIGKNISSIGKGFMASRMMSKFNPKNLVYGVQKMHDKLLGQASDIYDFIKSEVVPRGVSKIEIAPDLLEKAAKVLPDTDASKALIEAAKNGDYNALHQLQSDLGKRGFESKGASLYADRNLGDEMLEVRDKINTAIRDKFKEYGHDDLAKLLDEAKSKYRYLKETYYDHPAVARMVEESKREVPADPLQVFSEESKPMGKVLNAHPEINEALKTNRIAENFRKGLKSARNIGYGMGAAGTGIYAGNQLSNAIESLANINQNTGEQ